MKKIVLAVLLIVVLIGVFYFLFKPAKFSATSDFVGLVYDCETNAPVANAKVLILQNGGLLDIDTGHSYEGQTDQSGKFSIKYDGGSGMVTISKNDDNYLVTQGTFMGGELRAGLMKQQPGDLANGESVGPQCKKIIASGCMQTTVNNNVTEVRNVCQTVF